ncbi:MAG TPA: LptF/LptG family permease [Gemmatimonadales bacterium]|jgi:lipopolysaccharide export system permease protein|nr:LptF/LptG family permease [Gemmatimonadales bacterium]
MARPTVRILNRYILRQHLPPLAYALAALTCAMLVNQVAKQFGNLVGKGLPGSVILEVFVLTLPFIVAMTLPMAVLVAVLHAFSRLAADNEVTAMKASGISVGRLLVPVLGGAVVVGVFALAWNDQLLPRSNHRLRTLLVDIQRKKPTFQLKEQVINEVVSGQFFLRAARIDPASNRLKDVTIYDLEDAERRRIITADSGRMAYTPGGTDLYLTLLDGEIQEVKRTEPDQFNRTFYRTNRIRVAGIANALERTENDTYRGDREMTICGMRQVVAQAREDARRARRDARDAVVQDLRRLIRLGAAPADPAFSSAPAGPATAGLGLYCRLLGAAAGLVGPAELQAQQPAPPSPRPRPSPVRSVTQQPTTSLITTGATASLDQRVRASRQRAAIYEVEIQKKLAISAACVIFAVLGVPLAIRFPRGGVGLVIGTSLAVFSVYYVGLIGGEELGDRLIISPFLAMWTPNLLFTAVGLGLLWSVRREGSTAHGGDWDDLRAALFGWTVTLRRRLRA